MKGPRRRGWTPVGEIAVRGVARPLARRLTARTAWIRAVGADLARRLPALDLEGETLVIGIPDPRWEPVVRSLEEQVMVRLRNIPGMQGVTHLRTRPHARENTPAPLPAAPPDTPREGSAGGEEERPDAAARLEALARHLLGGDG